MWVAVATHGGVQRALRSFMTTSILSSRFLAWTHTKHSTPVRSLQQLNWTCFGAFHGTCTYTALCSSLFTYAGHHNNSHAKSYFNQTVIWSWPGFDTLDHSTNAISLIWTSFFPFLRLEFHFVAPKSVRIFFSYGRTDGRRTDFDLIWRLREPLRGPLKVFL